MRAGATAFLLALTLLTTLPGGRWLARGITPADQGRSVAFYPAVGLLIGLLLAASSALLAAGPLLVCAALLLLVWIGLTGGLHLDGLADSVDGWFAGHRDPERVLAVMKEPTAGPMAVIALVAVLMLKFAALTVLLGAGSGAGAALIAAPLVARAAVAALMATTPYRRAQGGIAEAQAATRSRGAIVLTLGLTWLGWALCLSLTQALGLVVVGGLVTGVWRALWFRQLGGYTGDIAGGLIELVEAAVLVAMAWPLGGQTPWA